VSGGSQDGLSADKRFSVSQHNFDTTFRSKANLPSAVSITDLTLREGRQIAGLALSISEIQAYAQGAAACGIRNLEVFNVPDEISAVCQVPNLQVQVLVPPTEVLDGDRAKPFQSYVSAGAHTLSLVSFALTPQNHGFVSNILGEPATPERISAETARSIGECKRLGVTSSVLLLDFLRADLEELLESIGQALDAGADIVRLDDCCGPAAPSVYRDVVGTVRRQYPEAKLAIHSHNDFGLALATQLAALEGGADIVEGSVLGLGEKAGVADITLLATTLEAFYGYETGVNLEKLLDLSEFVSDVWREPIPTHAPGIGRTAFAPASDVHYLPGCAAWTWNAWSAETVGNKAYVPISGVVGPYALMEKARELGEDLSPGEQAAAALETILAAVRVRRSELSDDFVRRTIREARGRN
jgi:2-isopropylmalate synthase